MNFKQLSTTQKGITALTVLTALMHILLGFFSLSNPFFFITFLFNGVGYLALLAALYFLPRFSGQRRLVRGALLGYTALTFVLYFIFNWSDPFNSMGIINKLVELALIILLLLDR